MLAYWNKGAQKYPETHMYVAHSLSYHLFSFLGYLNLEPLDYLQQRRNKWVKEFFQSVHETSTTVQIKKFTLESTSGKLVEWVEIISRSYTIKSMDLL